MVKLKSQIQNVKEGVSVQIKPQLRSMHFSVQDRLESLEGMSLTEFTYQIFQSYDWLHLYKTQKCNIQV